MNKLLKLALAVFLWSFLQSYPAIACRYNVREVGFVDLGIESYFLYGYVDKKTSAEITLSFEQIAYAALLDSNIKFEIIDVNQQKDHPAIKYLDSSQVQTFPSAALVSPDGQTLAVAVTKPGEPFEQTLRSALEDISSSPKRREILQQVSKAYGVVLLIESADAGQNKKAREAARGAIEQIASQMEYLPKPIAHPPAMVEISHESLAREKVLLWSLALDPNDIDQPHAAVLYGRARWIGPMFIGEQITEDNLAAVLFVIGADCECGFDQRWLQGTMLPARWDQKLLSVVAESLGFDPENPMIKAEISWIVRRGYPAYPGVPLRQAQGMALGYQELVVESEPNIAYSVQPTAYSVQHTDLNAKRYTLYAIFVGGLAVLVVAIGLFIAFGTSRKNL